ncbi:rhomboid family intramembrane serine protease [Lysobacteraceae bacterium NML75-0749]|nr:rhomboid family intramembrane serine protease [Xanthomonadaceae bacterium NML03-0222]PJK02035.1 rhomboid family intramembrane serine protease [Xanthomonadaceae bacterium NML75-0749]PJK03841.1 rhomboid family intramembrane serine protease [Xanthomonadaceae bacterium NML71-0210]PJK04490.1 rhomboid family intramembrane serine protease [Xanthomonadaceae bacterium NML91-0268]
MFVAIPPRKRHQTLWVTPLLVLLMCGSFVWTLSLPKGAQLEWLLDWGTVGIPLNLGQDWPSPSQWLKLFTALFLHSDWAHLIGNLVFLMIFGLPAERMMGAWRFLGLFLLGGAAANLAAGISLVHGNVLIGASGAVSATLGAWLMLFPRARLGVVVPLGLFLEFVRAPATVLIGLWVLLQAIFAYIGPSYGQVAWVAHLAGFVFGGLYALLSRSAIAKRMRKRAGY